MTREKDSIKDIVAKLPQGTLVCLPEQDFDEMMNQKVTDNPIVEIVRINEVRVRRDP